MDKGFSVLEMGTSIMRYSDGQPDEDWYALVECRSYLEPTVASRNCDFL